MPAVVDYLPSALDEVALRRKDHLQKIDYPSQVLQGRTYPGTRPVMHQDIEPVGIFLYHQADCSRKELVLLGKSIDQRSKGCQKKGMMQSYQGE